MNNEDQENEFPELKETILPFKTFNTTLSSQIKFIEEDITHLSLTNSVFMKNSTVYLNLNNLVKSFTDVISLYKTKLDLLDESNDSNKFLKSEICRLEKALYRRNQDYDVIDRENFQLRDSRKDLEKNIELLSIQLKSEKTAKRVSDSTFERERGRLKNDRIQMEKELEALKARLGKVLSDPKKQYPCINVTGSGSSGSRPLSVISSVSAVKPTIGDQSDAALNKELLQSARRHLQDSLLENRGLRDLVALHLCQLEQITGLGPSGSAVPLDDDGDDDREAQCELDDCLSSLPGGSSKSHRSNSTFSIDSDCSVKSDVTFVIAAENPTTSEANHSLANKKKTERDKRMLLEMPFHLIREEIESRFKATLDSLRLILRGECVEWSSVSRGSTPTPDGSKPDSSFVKDPNAVTMKENLTRQQREIFQLRKQLCDYEHLIQDKDLLLEGAIEQRMRRGSLLTDSSSNN